MHYSENLLHPKRLDLLLDLTVRVNNTPYSHLRLLSYCALKVFNLPLTEQCNNQPYLP